MTPKHLLAHMLAIVAIVVGTTACGTRSVNGSVASSKNDALPIYHVGDSLFALQYYDYDFNKCREYFDSRYSEPNYGACSQVRMGNFVGRNLDYNINRNACAVIKVEAKPEIGRHASIGVVGCFKYFTYDMAKTGILPDSLYHCLPGRTVDGINDCGVYVGVNVVPRRLDSSNAGYFYEGDTPDTTNAYNALYLTRLVLDSANSVDHAIELIKSHTWYFPKNYPTKDVEHPYQPFHWMIADNNTNCILEMENHGFTILKATGNNLRLPSDTTIMTNFSNSLWRTRELDNLGIGYERWDILHDNYLHMVDNEFGLFFMMRNVWFSNAYTLPCDTLNYQRFWFSELASETCYVDSLYKHGEQIVKDSTKMDLITKGREEWFNETNWFTDSTKLWFTVHTSIYRLQDMRFYIVPHEGYKCNPYQPSFDDNFMRYHFSIHTKFPLWKEDDTKE